MWIVRTVVALAIVALPAAALAQVENMGPKAATYITDEDVKKVNALPGVDRQIVSVDRQSHDRQGNDSAHDPHEMSSRKAPL